MDPITLPNSNQCYVVVGGQTAASRLLDLAARLALRGPLLLLDCGNRANPRPLVRELRRLTSDPVRALGNIQTARAFTCYQVLALLNDAAQRSMQQPVIIFDLLSTFYDENVTQSEARRLLDQCLQRIAAVHRSAPVVISARQPLAAFPERALFIEMVCSMADVLWVEDAPLIIQPQQLSLFP